MRPNEILALLLRYKLAVILVLVLSVGVLVDFKKTPPLYEETATVVFTTPVSTVNPNPYSAFAGSLVTAGDVMIRAMMSPASQRQVRAAGGSAPFSLQLVNLYNMEYPDYGVPYAILTATSPSPAIAHRTFVVVADQFNSILSTRQMLAGVRPNNRIATRLVGLSGPVALEGSSKRTYSGLMLLTLIAVFSVVNGLDRRRRRRRGRWVFHPLAPQPLTEQPVIRE